MERGAVTWDAYRCAGCGTIVDPDMLNIDCGCFKGPDWHRVLIIEFPVALNTWNEE